MAFDPHPLPGLGGGVGPASRDGARAPSGAEPAAGAHLGLGQRLLATDEGEYPLMDVRPIKLDVLDGERRFCPLAESWRS